MSMKQIAGSFVLLAAALLLLAVEVPKAAAADVWTAKYWNNRNMNGAPVLTRTESNLDHDWGDGSPADIVNNDNFSAQWTRNLYFAPGTYRFQATMDDGMRVYVNNNLIIDSWYDSQVHTVTADTFLSGGNHDIRVEYYDAGGKAVAKLSWYLVGNFAGSWRGEYFNNTALAGNPALVRFDPQVNFNWGGGSPAGGINADNFSVRWTSTLQLDPGTYRFTTTTDDGVRLWVNGQMVIDRWQPQAATTHTADVAVAGGSVPVQMEYFEGGGTAVAALTWAKISSPPAPAPQPPTTISNWRGEYYNNIDLAGSPVIVRDDPAIDFVWGSSSPLPNVINADRFSVRWTQTINFTPGRYIFTAYADDGVRVWVNGQRVIDAWGIHNVQPFAGAITLPGGAAEVRMEYFEYTGLAEARLTWAREGAAAPATPSSQPANAGAPDAATMTGARYLTVRSGPGIENEALGYLSSGQVVTLLGRDAFTVWVRVRTADGLTGWVSGRFLTANAPLSSLPVINP